MSLRTAYTFWFFVPVMLLSAVVGYSALTNEVGEVHKEVPGGNPERGKTAIQEYGCGSCHRIEGIRGANSLVGPPLVDFWKRHYIAGNLTNEAENLIVWIMNPQQIEPGTVMPNLNVSEAEARDIAAYLYSD